MRKKIKYAAARMERTPAVAVAIHNKFYARKKLVGVIGRYRSQYYVEISGS